MIHPWIEQMTQIFWYQLHKMKHLSKYKHSKNILSFNTIMMMVFL